MRLKKKNFPPFFKNGLIKNLFFKVYFFFSIFIFTLFLYLFLNTGYWERNKNRVISYAHLNGVINYMHYPEILYHKVSALFISQKKIYLNINQKNIYKIEQNRGKILKSVKLNSSSNRGHAEFITVNGSINDDEKNLKTNIRLKGDRKIHFENRSSSSYKLSLKKDNYFNHISKFSLQKPRIRNYLHEWIFHEILKKGNLVKIRYDFYDFYLNGEYLGYYNLEEGFGKTLLERNERRNGPIFSIYEEIKQDVKTPKFELYNKKFWTKPENISVAQKATQNLNNYFNETESSNDIFDIKKWAWFFAVVDLTYTYHGAALKSVKFYFNPINGKIEPIGYDGHRLLPNFDESIILLKPELNKTIFDLSKEVEGLKWTRGFFYSGENINKEFYEEYIKAINKIGKKIFLDEFFSKRKKDIKRITAGIYEDNYIYDYDSSRKSGIGIYYFDKKDTYRRANFLRNKFKINKTKLFIESNHEEVKFSSFDNNNIVLKNAKLFCNSYTHNISDLVDLSKKNNIIKFDNSKMFEECDKVRFTNQLDNKDLFYEINKYNSSNNFNNFFKIKNYKKYFQLHEKNLLKLKKNITEINEIVFIPKNHKVIIDPLQKIILGNHAFIYSNSPWQVIGQDKKKIFIEGKEGNFGGGIIITDTKELSIFENVNIANLYGFNNNYQTFASSNIDNIYAGNLIYGAINFNNTNVNLKNINVKKIRSEDAINIFNSSFYIDNARFFENSSDAIDVDFSEGKMKNLEFINIYNDAIDFSGSNASIKNVIFKNIGDKLVSVGENSIINIADVMADKSYVGLASKDGSVIDAKNITMKNVMFPFAAYEKKIEYTPSKIYLKDKIDIDNYHIKWVKDHKSKIVLNDKTVGLISSKLIPVIYKKKFKLLDKKDD